MWYNYFELPVKYLRLQLVLRLLEVRINTNDLVLLHKLFNSVCDCPELLHLMECLVRNSTGSQDMFCKHSMPSLSNHPSGIPRLLILGNETAEGLEFFRTSPESFRISINKVCSWVIQKTYLNTNWNWMFIIVCVVYPLIVMLYSYIITALNCMNWILQCLVRMLFQLLILYNLTQTDRTFFIKMLNIIFWIVPQYAVIFKNNLLYTDLP